MKWDLKTLDQLGNVSRGRSKHRPRDDKRLFGGKYPFIQTAEVKAANFYITDFTETYSDFGLSQSKLWHSGTLCITIAANIADSAILAIDACFPDSVMGFIPFEGVADVRFVKYCFDMLQRDCKQISQGTAQDNLSWKKLSTIKFPAPSYEEQVRIADILSAYDNLLENNQKQIKLLEEAAQRLYKEWFIDLRFPGYEATPVVDGVPEGWKKNRADSFFDITIGKTPPRSENHWFSDMYSGIPWISIADMGSANTFIFETSEGLTAEAVKRHNVKVIPSGTVVVSFKLTVGRVSIVTSDMCTNEAIAHFRANDDFWHEYTYCYLKEFPYDTLGSTSSISKAVNSKIIKAMPFVLPSQPVLKDFSKTVRPIFDNIRAKQSQNIYLREARDHLLPKLMSGEVEA